MTARAPRNYKTQRKLARCTHMHVRPYVRRDATLTEEDDPDVRPPLATLRPVDLNLSVDLVVSAFRLPFLRQPRLTLRGCLL